MLTQHAARGASLMLVASLLGRVAALAAQVVTGWILVDDDFGLFATAIGIQAFAGVLQGGNALAYLVTLPPAGRRLRTGTVFAISNGFYLIGVVPMLVLAPSLAAHFEAPGLVTLLWIMAATMMISPVRFVLRGRVNSRLAFGTGAAATIINNAFTYPLTIILAIVLRDATALAIPVLVGSVAEILFLWIRARPTRDDFRPRSRFVWPLLRQFRWLLLGAGMMTLFNRGDYMVAEFLVETSVLGVYYFGYQLAIQPGRLFTTTVLNILVPVVKRLSHDKARLATALRRLLSTGGFAIAFVNLGMLAVIEPLERLIWAGKWSDTVLTVQVVSIGITYTTILGVGTAPLMAERRYRESVVCGLVRAMGIVGGAAVGSIIWGTVDGIAVSVSVGMLLSAILGIAMVLRWHGVPAVVSIVHIFRATLPLVLVSVIAAAIGDFTLDRLDAGRVASAIALAVASGAYALFAVSTLLVIPRDTRSEVLRLMPGSLRRRMPRAWVEDPKGS
ncbi:oligosaccharide flippase family protein [bacterium]|nr:oligosaccharide flippase family protein [bacterium]